MDSFSIRIYVDIVLVVIVCLLTIFMCVYGFYFIYRVLSTQTTILLRPRRVLFSFKKEEGENEELRTVVAYQNPFTGDYCVNKTRTSPKGYTNAPELLDSPDSGVSDAYEPLHEPFHPAKPHVNEVRDWDVPIDSGVYDELFHSKLKGEGEMKPPRPSVDDNSVNKTWNWNYKEYQI